MAFEISPRPRMGAAGVWGIRVHTKNFTPQQLASVPAANEVKTTLDKVDMLIEKGKSVDDALKLLGIDKEEYLKMREEYADKKKVMDQVNTLMKEKGYSEAKALKVLSIDPKDYAKWKEEAK